MKIAYTGVSLPEGKIKYNDESVNVLVDKFNPKKISPYFFEFMPDNYENAAAIVISSEQVLDLLILDIEKLENRLERTESDAEKEVLKKCLSKLEDEVPVCDIELNDEEKEVINILAPLSLKPTLVIEDTAPDPNEICRQAMEKADMMFFYTAGKEEVHAWFTKRNSTAVECAGKIHTDLARGFIKADVVSVEELLTVYNYKEAISSGLAKLVDKDFPVPENSVLEIRFNV